jgi:guanyl-specific ribonuclease Sa
MFAYCRGNPVCRVDISGTVDMKADDFDGNPSIDEEDVQGNGPVGGTWTGQNVNSVKNIPPSAWDTLNHIKNHNGSPPEGYKGGGTFANDGRNGGERLPNNYGPFRKYDVHPKVAGQDRGRERIVIGNGAAWYTSDHYKTFIKME